MIPQPLVCWSLNKFPSCISSVLCYIEDGPGGARSAPLARVSWKRRSASEASHLRAAHGRRRARRGKEETETSKLMGKHNKEGDPPPGRRRRPTRDQHLQTSSTSTTFEPGVSASRRRLSLCSVLRGEERAPALTRHDARSLSSPLKSFGRQPSLVFVPFRKVSVRPINPFPLLASHLSTKKCRF